MHNDALSVKPAAHMVYDVMAPRLQDREMFDRFLLNMLDSLDSAPLERIHNMLKMFIVEPHPYDKTEEQLAAELSRLVTAGKLATSGGMYRIDRSEGKNK